tara:strand:+ start:212 stop:538 length:327 start_codon:yes stop_codon:yes gene_type:complete
MNYLLIGVNVILTIIIICHIYNNWIVIKEGLEGCPASSSEEQANRKRGASKREISSTIKDLNSQINALDQKIGKLDGKVGVNKIKLEAISKEAAEKAKRNKEKMDKMK